MTAWNEKYRPKSSNNYIFANRNIMDISVNYLNSILQKNPLFEGLLYEGPPGTGKTSMAQVLESAYEGKLNFVYHNASDERKKRDAMKLIQKGKTKANNQRTLLILDEAESMGYMNKIIKNTNPIIIVNNMYDLDRSVRDKLTTLSFDYPSQDKKEELINQILRKENENIPYSMRTQIAKKSKSFRQVLNNLQLTVVTKEVTITPKDDWGLFEEIQRHFAGKTVRNADVKPRELLEWAFDNNGSPELISALDRIMGVTKRNDYRDWRYVYDLISKTNANSTNYPYSWKMRGRIKSKVKKEKKKKKSEKEKVKKEKKNKKKSKSFMDFVGD